jgi:hypothetical protein
VVLRAPPDEYASVINAEQGSRGDKLELSHLRASMNKYYRTVHKKITSDEDDDKLANNNEKDDNKRE